MKYCVNFFFSPFLFNANKKSRCSLCQMQLVYVRPHVKFTPLLLLIITKIANSLCLSSSERRRPKLFFHFHFQFFKSCFNFIPRCPHCHISWSRNVWMNMLITSPEWNQRTEGFQDGCGINQWAFSVNHMGILCVLNIEESFTSLPSLIIMVAIIDTITSSEMLGLKSKKGSWQKHCCK